VSELKSLANNAGLVECKSKTDRDILEKELSKLPSQRRAPQKKTPDLIVHVRA